VAGGAGGGNHGGTSSCKMVAAQPEGLECSMFTMETTRRPSRLRDTRKRLGRFECHKIERWAQTSGAFISASYNAPLYPRETHQQVSRMASPHRRHYHPTGQAWLSSVRRIQAKTCCSLFRPLITVSSLPVSIISAETSEFGRLVADPRKSHETCYFGAGRITSTSCPLYDGWPEIYRKISEGLADCCSLDYARIEKVVPLSPFSSKTNSHN
jgi:hypothetical protein